MSPPTVRVNTFMKKNEKLYIDPISKIFIIAETLFGLNRIPLLGKGQFFYVLLSMMIFLAINAVVMYILITEVDIFTLNPIIFVLFGQNIISTVLSFTRFKIMQQYYGKLNGFDMEVSCRPKIAHCSIQNIVQAALSCLIIVLIFFVPVQIGILNHIMTQLLPLFIVYVLEMYYFAHLLHLLAPRLKLINYYMKSSLSNAQLEPSPILKEFTYFTSHAKGSQCSMRKLMDLFQMIVEAYDYLIEGIKWQLLTLIVTAFVAILGFLYQFSLKAIRDGQTEAIMQSAVVKLGFSVILLIPLFAPCTFADRIHKEVRKLRELLASRLYENKLDKSGRSIARALLAFTETRDLSFRLLRMINIDISLPFNFMGLIITYLIIMLQFERVINP